MSILDKYPAPWKRGDFDAGQDEYGLYAANGERVSGDFDCVKEVEALILAAPELLAFVLKLKGHDLDVETEGNVLNDERDALIARIEGSDG
jgi:hypothetical protein